MLYNAGIRHIITNAGTNLNKKYVTSRWFDSRRKATLQAHS